MLSGAAAQDSPAGAEEAEQPESGPTPENQDASRAAREHFQEGMGHFASRQFRRAIEEFTLAAGLVPSADLWFNIARAHEELDEFSQASEFYRRYLRDRVDPPDREAVEARITHLGERAEAARLARQNRPTTGSLRVSANVEGAAVQLDNADAGQTPIDESANMQPGAHALVLEREGYIPFRSEVQVEAGMTTGAYADLQPRTEYRSIRGRRVFTWVAAGLVAAGAATSIGFGVRARGLRNDGFDTPAGPERDLLIADARDRARVSDIVLGATLGMAVVGLILYFIEGRSVGTERISGPELTTPPAVAETAGRLGAYVPRI